MVLEALATFLILCIGIFAGYSKGNCVGYNKGYEKGWEEAHSLQEGLDGYKGGKV